VLWRRGHAGWRGSARLLAAFTVVTLGMRWAPRYLFGISVDQQFRTEYLTRLTDSPPCTT
jgi:galactan 5-O-arabinofuranosyltransferase